MADTGIDEVRARSWFCVFNNPEEHGYAGTEQEICDNLVSAWVDNNPTRSCAVCYCVSADGLFLSTLSLRRATAKVHKTVGHFCAYETNFMGIASSC